MAPTKAPRSSGSAPRLGELGLEPADSPSSDGISAFGGGPTVGPPLHKGEKQVGGPGADIYPEPYGGAPAITKRKGQKRASGSGDLTGAGDGRSAVIP